MKMIGDWL